MTVILPMRLLRVAPVALVLLALPVSIRPWPALSNAVFAQAPANPCTAALAQDGRSGANRVASPGVMKGGGYGADARDVRDLLWPSSLAARVRALDGSRVRPASSQDIGGVAVLEDDGTLILPPNAFDLRGAGFRFEPNGSGYDVAPADPAFRSSLGRRVSLGDDDTTTEAIPFGFPYFGQRYSTLFINSDGNLTFDESDTESSARGFARLLGGPPRVAPFFADLDPTAGGRVFVEAASDAFSVTWCAVPAYDSLQTMTVQVVLGPEGAIDVRFGAELDLGDGIVAVSPGRTATFAPVDLSGAGRKSGGSSAVGERFAVEPDLDLVQAARRFYQSHADDFDQLVFWTDTRVVSDAFAFESTVQNRIRGIGVELFDASGEFGSAGALQSVVNMDRVAKYGDDPAAKILGENSALAVLAHETGHRWLVRLLFSDGRGGASDLLLGRQLAHWSFFVDSDASVMEGNDIEDLRGGTFRTVAAAERYSRLDLYAMGAADASEVPGWFYVDAPVNVVPERRRESAPRVGITFGGTRRDVRIQDVMDVLGPREPRAAESPRLHRQAFVYVIQRGTTPNATDVSRLERLRAQWEPYFHRATEERMTVRTTLVP